MASVGFFRCSEQQPNAKTIPLGLQLYSVRHDCEKDLVATIKQVAEIGYQGVEFAGFYNYTAKDIKAILDDHGLLCCGSHTQLADLAPETIDATIEFNAILGNKYLIVPWLPEERRQTVQDWIKLASDFNALAEKAKTHAMRVGYHNHDFEFKPLEGQLPWDVFAQYTDKDVILQLDTGNCGIGGGDALATLVKYPGRAVTIHLKEYSATNPNAILGEGDIPWKQVFTFCETQGATEWYIIEEEKDIYPPLEAVAKCYANFQSLQS
ncbi:TIM barrel protein [candidate division KSB1 bacterium]|nr:TIM barrel protein [candidate division KSB1 bacterium]RQW11437.1 MAG: sugar phosphate isomerase/epimerase [candidate division KSB1 bacterium]